MTMMWEGESLPDMSADAIANRAKKDIADTVTAMVESMINRIDQWTGAFEIEKIEGDKRWVETIFISYNHKFRASKRVLRKWNAWDHVVESFTNAPPHETRDGIKFRVMGESRQEISCITPLKDTIELYRTTCRDWGIKASLLREANELKQTALALQTHAFDQNPLKPKKKLW